MKKVYLDYNIWDEMLKKPCTLLFYQGQTEYSYYLSVAHFEELFHARNNETEQYKGCANKLMDFMLKNSVNGLIKYRASIDFISDAPAVEEAIHAIEVEHDTQELIKALSEQEYNERSEETKKGLIGIKGVKPEDVFMKIWDQPQITDLLAEKNRKAQVLRILIAIKNITPDNAINLMPPEWINEYGVNDQTKFLAFRTILSEATEIRKDCYNDIKGDCVCLQSIIEILNSFLLTAGYKQDTKPDTYTSGKYDLQHFILSTYCDVFITGDERFYERAKSIAYYLGIPIEVKLWKNGQLI